MLRKCLTASVLLALSGSTAFAVQAFKVKQVEFEGLQHFSKATVEASLPLHAGDELTPALSNKVISDLFATGFFSNIQLLKQGDALVIKVTERPTIASVHFSGNDSIKTKMLNQVLQKVGFLSGNVFDPTVLRQMVQSLKDQYFAQGKYSVKVHTELKALPRNRVAVTVKISEGIYNQVTGINVVGNKAFSESTLKDQLSVTTPKLWSFITRGDVYSQQKLSSSLKSLNDYYTNRGYINFHVDSTETALSPSHTHTYLTINVSEGKQYKFSGFSFEGHLILPESKLNSMVDITKGEVFSRQEVLNAAKAITTALGNKGYAFAKVDPVPKIDKKNHTVHVTFEISPGKPVYVRYINFMGNTVSNDSSLRNYLTYSEQSLYNASQLDNSKLVLQRLPYLQSVEPQTVPVAGSPDKVDIDYHLHERSVNSVRFSIGYSELDKFLLGVNLGLPNVFGTGNSFSINTQLSKPYQSLSFSYTEPFFTNSGIQQTISAYVSRVNNAERNLTNYSTNSFGGSVSYAIPLNNTDFFNFGLGYDFTTLLEPSDNTSETVAQFLKAQGRNSFNTVSLTAGWSRDSTNNAFFPTQGVRANIGAQVATPLSTLTWYKLNSSLSWFYPLTQDLTLALDGGANFGDGYGKTKQLPFFNNYYGGSWGSVRGYSAGSLGPNDALCPAGSTSCSNPTEGQSIGGNLRVFASANVYFPVPFTDNNPNFRLGVFADMGNVYDTYKLSTIYQPENQQRYPNFSNLRYSVGLAFKWISPMGPLAFSLAKPLNEKSGDDINIFQFTIGTNF